MLYIPYEEYIYIYIYIDIDIKCLSCHFCELKLKLMVTIVYKKIRYVDWIRLLRYFLHKKYPSLESIGSHMHYISVMYSSVKPNRKTNFVCV